MTQGHRRGPYGQALRADKSDAVESVPSGDSARVPDEKHMIVKLGLVEPVGVLPKESTHETIIPVRWPALAGGDPTGRAILALDLGQKTGWAVRSADGAIASGTVEFKPGRFEGGGMVFLRFRAWLQEVDETAGGIGAMYFEEVRAHRGVIAAQSYGAFLGHLTAWAEMFKIPYRGVPVGTIKRHITGRGNADKDAVIAVVRALGFDPFDDNEADALALLDWALKGVGRR
jgi:crossover junction endodeoxyribonuclease RuvC